MCVQCEQERFGAATVQARAIPRASSSKYGWGEDTADRWKAEALTGRVEGDLLTHLMGMFTICRRADSQNPRCDEISLH